MKIAIWHNLPSGGGKRALYYQVKGLVERGHHVEVWSPSTADQKYLPLDALAPEHVLDFDHCLSQSGTRLLRDLPHADVSGRRLRAMVQHCREVANQIEMSNFEILLAHPCRYFRTSPIGRFLKIPKVLYLQEPYRRFYEATPRLLWWAYSSNHPWYSVEFIKGYLTDSLRVRRFRTRAREEALNAEAFDLILANSFFSRESILRAYGLESIVCYLGVDTDLFHPTTNPKEGFVVGLGSIHGGKGIARTLSALSKIHLSKRPDLIWIGNSVRTLHAEKMKSLANELGVNLVFQINIPDSELVDLLSRALVMVYTPRLEPFGFAPLEANACGTAVVGIAEGGVRETIKDGVNGILVHEDSAALIGKALGYFVAQPEIAKEMGLKARQYVLEHWTWGAAVERLEGFLQRAISQKELV